MDVDIDQFNFESLTLGEAEELEDIIGVGLDKLEDASQIKLMRAVVFIMARRKDPEFTYEGTADMQLSDVTELMGGVDPS